MLRPGYLPQPFTYFFFLFFFVWWVYIMVRVPPEDNQTCAFPIPPYSLLAIESQ